MHSSYDVYVSEIPPGVLSLDFLAREVELDAREGDVARARTDVDRIASVWDELRPKVVRAGGRTEAGAFDASIKAQREAIRGGDTTRIEAGAATQLELVDGIEAVFSSRRESRPSGR